MQAPTLAWSNFASNYSRPGTGNSYSALSDNAVIDIVRANWHLRKPGTGETGLDRKVLVPVPPDGFFCQPRATLVPGMPVRAEVVVRQVGEQPYIQTYVTPQDAEQFGALVEIPAKSAEIVCYSVEALLENNGQRSSDAEWEIVTMLCSASTEQEPMAPLTMARNYLQMPGGTFGDYTARQFAEAIWYHAQQGVRVRNPSAGG